MIYSPRLKCQRLSDFRFGPLVRLTFVSSNTGELRNQKMEKETFLLPINEKQLESAYEIDAWKLGARLQKELRTESRRLHCQLLEGTSDGNKLVCRIGLYTNEAEPVLDQDLERWMCDNKRLRQSPNTRAKVAYRLAFFVRSIFQNEGLATAIIPREEDVFRRWGAIEVQTDAMYSGRWVWTRPRFGYSLQQFQFDSLQQQYKDWQRSRGKSSILSAKNLSEFPRDFLLSSEVNSLGLFKSL